MTAFYGKPAAPGFPAPDQPVAHDLEQMYAQLQGWMGTDHNPDGTHDRVRAVSVTTAEGVQEFGRSQTLGVAELIGYDPALFTASGAMTWAPTEAQMVNVSAARIGNLMWMGGEFLGVNVGGVAGGELRFKLPYDLVCVGKGSGHLAYIDAGAAFALGEVFTSADADYLSFNKLGSVVWTVTAANNTTLRFNIVFPVKQNPV